MSTRPSVSKKKVKIRKSEWVLLNDKKELKRLRSTISKKLLKEQINLDGQIIKLVDEHFWELI